MTWRAKAGWILMVALIGLTGCMVYRQYLKIANYDNEFSKNL